MQNNNFGNEKMEKTPSSKKIPSLCTFIQIS